MALNFNSNNITQVNWNGNSLTQVNWNGVKVWPVITPVEPNYFYTKCLTTDSLGDPERPASVVLHDGGSGYFPTLYYSTDKVTWTLYVADTSLYCMDNDIIYWKAGPLGNVGIQNDNRDSGNHNVFVGNDGTFEAGGDITTILSETGGITDQFALGNDFAFARMFQGQSRWYSCANLVLPTTIGHTAFHYTFYQSGIRDFPDCSHITKIGYNAFGSCFRECGNATGSVDFSNVVEYPFEEGIGNQYAFSHTFRQSGITSAKFSTHPGEYRTFNSTFYNCSAIQVIEVGWTSWNANSWVNGVNGTGTFKCPTALGTNETIQRGASYCPSNFTVINTD